MRNGKKGKKKKIKGGTERKTRRLRAAGEEGDGTIQREEK